MSWKHINTFSKIIKIPSFDLKNDGITEIIDDEKDTSTTSTTDIIIPNSTNTFFRRSNDDGLSSGALCAFIIPLCIALLATTIFAFTCKAGPSGPSTIVNTPMPNQDYIDSQYNFPIITQT